MLPDAKNCHAFTIGHMREYEARKLLSLTALCAVGTMPLDVRFAEIGARRKRYGR